MLPNNIYQNLTKIFSSYKAIEKVILYGSRAIGDHEEKSDIDLAVYAPMMGKKEWLTFVFELEENSFTLLPIDVVRLEEVSLEFYEQIMKNGRILYQKGKPITPPVPSS